ncbi:MAG: hypothetical protein EPN30_06925 [Actinomycetota bacterium]|nr:MAG: hypothetical protein EPN30_06925 [Actinomycetota bacterium]
MHNMTIQQLRAASNAGEVLDVTLKGHDGAFLVQIATRSGPHVVLAKAHSSEPRRFCNPITAVNILRDIGITISQFDASEWNPAEKEEIAANSGRTDTMRKVHQAVTYTEWLAAEIQESIDDPRPSLPHNEVMARMAARIARYKKPA